MDLGCQKKIQYDVQKKKKKIEKYLVQEHIFRNHWHDKLSEALTLDEMAQKFDTVQEKRITKMQ